MLKWAILLLVVLFWVVKARGKSGYCNITGYYWKDYFENVPKDALPCGRDDMKRPMFIGQKLKKNNLVPGKIYIDYPVIYIEVKGKEHEFTDKFKILCAARAEYFEWIKTNNSQLLKIRNHLVIGGYHPNCDTFIGRTFIGEELLAGKVLVCNDGKRFGLHLCWGKKCKFYETYEVLSYNPVIGR